MFRKLFVLFVVIVGAKCSLVVTDVRLLQVDDTLLRNIQIVELQFWIHFTDLL